MKQNRMLFPLLLLLSSFDVHASEGFNWLGGIAHSLHLPIHVLTFILVGLVLLIVSTIYRIKVREAKNIIVPDRGFTLRNIVEAYGEFIYGLCKSVIGEKEGEKYFSTISTVFLFILLSNLMGLIPGFLPPTDNINTTLALGIFVFIYYNYHGIKEQGIVGHIKHFMGPVWYLAFLIFPIEIISHAVRPISLALRLRGNMFGDHLVLGIFSDLVPYVVPVIFMFLGLFVCLIQAFVFTLLTMVYISLATAHHDHDEAHS